MAKVKLEILRTLEITREERVEVDVDVPADILADPIKLDEWVEEQLDDAESELSQASVRNWEGSDEREDTTIDEVNVLGDAD